MALQPTVLPVSVDQQNVLLNLIATNLQVLVELYHIVVKKMVLQPIMLPVSADHKNVLMIRASIVPIPLHSAVHLNRVPLPMVLCPTQTVVPALLKSAPQRMVLFAMHPQIHVLQVIAEQMQLPRKLCQIVKLSIHVVVAHNANQIGIHAIVQNHVLIP